MSSLAKSFLVRSLEKKRVKAK